MINYTLSHQQGCHPTRLAILDSDERLLGEFWNSGIINEIACADLDVLLKWSVASALGFFAVRR